LESKIACQAGSCDVQFFFLALAAMVANPSLGAGWFDLVEKNEGKAAVLWAEANNRRSKRTKRIASSDEFDPSPLQIAFFKFS
jgi:hypothetical protein